MSEPGWGDQDTASPASTPKAAADAPEPPKAEVATEAPAPVPAEAAPAEAAPAAAEAAPAADVVKVEEVVLTPEELAAKEEADKLKALKAVEKTAADFAALYEKADEQQYKRRLTVIQADPNSRLFAVSKFEDLNLTVSSLGKDWTDTFGLTGALVSPEILKGVYAMGFYKLSRFQEHALPMILADPPTNGIFQAQSGSGKTVAFTLGMLSRCDASLKECQALCVSPTCELANQTMRVVETMGQNTGMRFRRAMPGFEVERGTKITEQVIVGTPGRVEMWLKKKFINPKHFRIFVLDQADEMCCDSSNKSRTKGIVTALPRTCQLLLFSATFPEEVYVSIIISHHQSLLHLASFSTSQPSTHSTHSPWHCPLDHWY
jgi:ATP-dependent RNA helicase DDX19/DBP5